VSGSQTIGGYTLLEKLGEGGMGAVWLALDPRTGARRALKVLTTTDPELRLRFAREGEAMARVDGHANLLRVHSAGEDRGRAYLIMDVAAGGTLAQRLRDGRLPPEEVVALGRTLAGALAHVHARGVLHRDLKPSNVLFDEAGAPKLADFGLARPVDHSSLTASGTILGTPAYMAPEQADGRTVDARADVYALGAVLYHATTGRPPHAGGTAMAVLAKVLTTDPPTPRSLVPGLPPALDGVLRRAMARDPAARFQTAAALAEALGAVSTEDARSRWPLGAGLAAVAIVIASLGLASLRPVRTPGAEEAVVPASTPSAAASTAPTTTAWSAEAVEALVLRGELGALSAALDGLEPATRAATLSLLEGPPYEALPLTPEFLPIRRALSDFVKAREALDRSIASTSLQVQDPAVLDDLIRTARDVKGPVPVGAAARVSAQRQIVSSFEAVLRLKVMHASGSDRGSEWLRQALDRARLLAPDSPCAAGLRVLHASLCFSGDDDAARRRAAFADVDSPALDALLAVTPRAQVLQGLRATVWLATASPLEAASRWEEAQAHAESARALDRPGAWKIAEAHPMPALPQRIPAARSAAAAFRAWLLRDEPDAASALQEARALADQLDGPQRPLHQGRLHAMSGEVELLREAVSLAPKDHQCHLLQAELDLLSGGLERMLPSLSAALNDPQNGSSTDPEYWCVLAAAQALAGGLPRAREHLAHARRLGPGSPFLPWRSVEETERLLAHVERGWKPERLPFPPR
jgi:serine/threonine-protein kinase